MVKVRLWLEDECVDIEVSNEDFRKLQAFILRVNGMNVLIVR